MFVSTCTFALLLLAASNALAQTGDHAQQIRQLTGAETRIVWIRHKQWEGKPTDHLDGGSGYSVMAFGTEDKKGERELAPEGELYNPLISPNGGRVIYSAKTDGKLQIHVVDWNGANSRVLSDGYGMCLWSDPATGIEWVYASNDRYGNLLDRFQIDNPKVREKLYTGDKSHRLSISADGTCAAGEFPWPHASVLYFRTGQVDRKNYRTGCNVYMSPDNSYMVSIMDGGHTRVTIYKTDGSSRDISVVPPGLKPPKNGGGGVVWNPKWASDARYMSVAGPFTNLKPDRADIWLGQFADDFNSIPKWVQVTDNDYMDNFAYVWVRPKGMKDESSGGKAGASKQGDGTQKKMVRANERIAPKLLKKITLDDRRVLLTCSEPVLIDQAVVTRTDGTPAVKLALDSEERGIVAEFAAPLAAKETLTVTGVTDRAQTPNKMAVTKAQIVQPDWPSNLAGLCYLWKNDRTRNVIFDERIGLPVSNGLNRTGQARFNRDGAAMAAGGTFDPGSAESILEGIKKTRQFSFEIAVASADLAQTKGNEDKPIGIVNWCLGWGNGVFWLLQEKDKLLVGLSKQSGDPKPEVFEMATLPDTQPHHVIVSYANQRLAFYLDGKKVKEIDPSPALFIEEGAPPITFAGHPPDPDKNTWRGTFEYVAIYSRFIEADEAAKNAVVVAAGLAKRKPLPRIEVQATLIGMSKIPQPSEMTPYRNALVVSEYSVEKVLKGTYAGKTLRVVQWGRLDLKSTPLAEMKPGTSVKLVLETFADHDELVPELISDTLKEDYDLKLYTDVNL